MKYIEKRYQFQLQQIFYNINSSHGPLKMSDLLMSIDFPFIYEMPGISY